MTDPYFVGTEDIHFIPIGGPLINANAGTFRSPWARCSLQCNTTLFMDERWRAPLASESVSTSEFWWSCQSFQNGAGTIGRTGLIGFLGDYAGDATGTSWRLMLVGQGGRLPALYRQNDGAFDSTDNPLSLPYSAYFDELNTQLATGFLPMPSLGRVGKLDIYVNLSSGIFRLYVDLVLVLDFTGDLTGGQYSAFTGFDLMGSHTLAHFSEIYWHPNIDTRKLDGVYSIWPTSAGHTTGWTGTFADVDEITSDLSDANYTGTSGLIQQYKTRALPTLTGNIRISAVMLGTESETGPTDEALNIRVNSTDYFGSSFDTGGVPERRMKIWGSNPGTAVDFTKTELNSTEFNIGVKST